MDGNFFGEKFIYGASYAPYAKSMDWPMEEWENDFITMKKLNFNTVRIFVPWDRIEKKEGKLDFSKQDYLMDIAHKHDIGVILNVGGVFDNLQGIYPPQWLAHKYDTSTQQEDANIPKKHSGPRIRICLDDPIYRKKAFAFIKKAVCRYAVHPATIGWMVWNEPHLGNCYCRHTRKRFNAWLKEKYAGQLDRLNELWGSEFPVEYERWEDVEAPTGVGFLGGGLNPWRDWLEFTDFRLADAMLNVQKIVHENDPAKHPCSSNMINPFRQLSPAYQSLDIAGYSYYNKAHGESHNPFRKSLKCSTYRWFSKDEKRRTLVLETEAGPNNAMITQEGTRFNNYLALGHNAKSFVLWNYRSRYSDSQVCNFNLMGWDGSITPRAEGHAKLAKTFNDHAALIHESCPEAAAAVLMPDNLTLLAMTTHCGIQTQGGKYEDFQESRFGAFKLLWDMNVTADGIAECHLENIGNYKVVLLPLIENMTSEIADVLTRYVKNGGTLIAESPFAFKDENNFLRGTAPIYGLDKIFGASTRDREGKETASEIIYSDKTKGKVHFLWHPYEPTTGKAVAKYKDGRAAVVVNKFGKGTAIVAGTEFFRQYYNEPDSANAEFLRKAVLDSGVKRNAEIFVKGKIAEASGIEVCRLSGKKGIIYIILNHNDKKIDFSIRLQEKGSFWKNLETDKKIDMTKKQTLQPNGVLAIYK